MASNVFDKPGARVRLADISTDPPKGMTKAKAAERLAVLEKELFELQDAMFGAKTTSVLVVLQGRDGAGKDGTIKNVVGNYWTSGMAIVFRGPGR